MKKANPILLICSTLVFIMTISRCSKEIDKTATDMILIESDDDPKDPENEDTGIIISEDQILSYSSLVYQRMNELPLKYGTIAHQNFVYNCAKKLGLSEDRAIIMRNASVMPDEFQSGIDNAFNQQWSHAYIAIETFWGMQWVWGDADDDFYDNLLGDSGESESPEGYNGKWAGYYYISGERNLGDWYVGYACHYITDVSFVLHSSFPDANMLLNHFNYESWIDNNWDKGHNFSAIINTIPISEYYTISDPKSAIRNAVKNSNYSYSLNAQKAWDNYKKSGFPTGTGTGNADCIYYTGKMIEEATRWTGSAIKYALDRYDQW